MGELSDLPNIGKVVEGQLNEAGEGAIQGVKKSLISQERKSELKEFYNLHKKI